MKTPKPTVPPASENVLRVYLAAFDSAWQRVSEQDCRGHAVRAKIAHQSAWATLTKAHDK